MALDRSLIPEALDPNFIVFENKLLISDFMIRNVIDARITVNNVF